MVYSESQKKLLEYITSTNDICVPSTIIRKIMEITGVCVIEFNRKKKEVVFHSSTTGDNMIPQRFIQCLVILDKLERDHLIYVEKGNSNLSYQQYISVDKDILLKSKVQKTIQSEPENMIYSFCHKFYDTKCPRPIQRCGMRKTNAYDLILKYASAFIYPSPELIEFVENGYKTPENIRFETQLNIERKQHKREILLTRLTLVAAVLTPLITCWVDHYLDSNTITLLNKNIKVELIDTIQTHIVSDQSFEKDTSNVISPDKLFK